jgi:hypothetical protein
MAGDVVNPTVGRSAAHRHAVAVMRFRLRRARAVGDSDFKRQGADCLLSAYELAALPLVLA